VSGDVEYERSERSKKKSIAARELSTSQDENENEHKV